MPRKPRLHVPGGIYHAILRGNNRGPLFFDAADRDTLEALLAEGLVRYRCRVHAYCWMTNHLHLAVQVDDEPLGHVIQWVGSNFARTLNRRYGRSGHVFDRRHRAILVSNDLQLLALVRYIHQNPVVANLVNGPADYRWSSHRAYLGRVRVAWLTTRLVLDMFGDSGRCARANYRAFMSEKPDSALEEGLENGSEDDPRLASSSVLDPPIDALPVSHRAYRTLDEIVATTCEVYGIRETALRSAGRSRRYAAIRTEIAAFALDEGAASLSEVARRFRRCESVLCRALSRFRRQTRGV